MPNLNVALRSALLLAALAGSAGGRRLAAQAVAAAEPGELIALIRCAPLTAETRAGCTRQNFGRRAEQFLLRVQPPDSGRFLRAPPDQSDPVALELYYGDTRYWLGELEDELAREGTGFVVVAVRSKPTGLEVRYRRASQSAAATMPSITTDTQRRLQPAWYVFTAVNPETKRRSEQMIDCSINCEVDFNLK